MRFIENGDGILSSQVRDLFHESYVKRLDYVDCKEWWLVIEHPAEICIGTRYSTAIEFIRLVKGFQLISRKIGRIGQRVAYQRPVEIETRMLREAEEIFGGRVERLRKG